MLSKISNYISNFNQDVKDSIVDKFLFIRIRFLLSQSKKKDIFDKICTYLDDDINLGTTLYSLRKIYNRKNSSSLEYKMVRYLYEKYTIEPKASFIFAPFFDQISMSIIQAMEQSESTHKGLKLAQKLMEIRRELSKKATNAVTLLFGALFLMIGICIAMKTFVFDKLVTTMPQIASSHSVTVVYKFLQNFVTVSPFLILLIIFFGVFCMWSVPNQIKNRPTFLPPWSILDRLNSALFLYTLAKLTEADVPIFQSLTEIKGCSTKYIGYWCGQIQARRLQSMSMGQSLGCNLFDKNVRIEIEAYAQVKDIAENFQTIADMVVDITKRKLQIMSIVAMITSFGIIMGINATLAISIIGSISELKM